MNFDLHVREDDITLIPTDDRGLLRKFFGGQVASMTLLSAGDRRLAFAIADLKALAEQCPDALSVSDTRIRLSHRLAASLDAKTGAQLGLPQLTDLTLRTDVDGVIGDPGFRLRTEWYRGAQRKTPRRTGSILMTDRGEQRLPLWMLDALDMASGQIDATDAAHWEALARFRRALDPGISEGGGASAARISMTDFLSGLEVSLSDGFSIAPNATGDDFEVIPFSQERLAGERDSSEAMSELSGRDLAEFQRKLRQRGALNAFRLGPGRFMVIDQSAAPALQVMAEVQRAPRAEREEFIRNPRRRISDAVENALNRAGALDELDDIGREDAIDRAAGPLLVETAEFAQFSARVIGIGLYAPPTLSVIGDGATTWLPELFSEDTRREIRLMPMDDLAYLAVALERAIAEGTESVTESGVHVPAQPDVLRAVKQEMDIRSATQDEVDPSAPDSESETKDADRSAPAILQTQDNFDDVQWRPALAVRAEAVAADVPRTIRTSMRLHQLDSLDWQAKAWASGLPGILNADEQGLGKTLQTIAFLVWLNDRMATDAARRGPVLIVAPTSLLENWEQEVALHVGAPGLGHLIRLYGSGISSRRKVGTKGMDTANGEALLDFGDLDRSIASGNGHLTWVLTTYATLTNYQHSLAKIPFAVVVFDEIQALKTPGSLRACAARAVNADFRIGLTGTPIENATSDLWAIMDQLAPGSLGSLRDFREKYAVPQEDNMHRLHQRVFGSDTLPPLALRRLKDEVAKDLPLKARAILPYVMPDVQAEAYDDARIKLAMGGKGAALKMLHHIRSVSVHPDLSAEEDDAAFIDLSARLQATFRILADVKSRDERALVFIEHLQMQYRFIELAKAAFGLPSIDLINGSTAIKQRQAIVNRFQAHLQTDGGFDLLVLAPRAAGTGLTLTAATHVIHLSRWWNPAVEEQCNDRVHRIGQSLPVHVHVPMAIHPAYRSQSFDCLLHNLMQRKRKLAGRALWPMGDTEEDAAFLQNKLGAAAEIGKVPDPVKSALTDMYKKDGLLLPDQNSYGEFIFN